jgi:hypothetical protein
MQSAISHLQQKHVQTAKGKHAHRKRLFSKEQNTHVQIDRKNNKCELSTQNNTLGNGGASKDIFQTAKRNCPNPERKCLNGPRKLTKPQKDNFPNSPGTSSATQIGATQMHKQMHAKRDALPNPMEKPTFRLEVEKRTGLAERAGVIISTQFKELLTDFR